MYWSTGKCLVIPIYKQVSCLFHNIDWFIRHAPYLGRFIGPPLVSFHLESHSWRNMGRFSRVHLWPLLSSLFESTIFLHIIRKIYQWFNVGMIHRILTYWLLVEVKLQIDPFQIYYSNGIDFLQVTLWKVALWTELAQIDWTKRTVPAFLWVFACGTISKKWWYI